MATRALARGELGDRSPRTPQRAGTPLRGKLEGLYAARRGEFRVIYAVEEPNRVVLSHRAQHGQAEWIVWRLRSRPARLEIDLDSNMPECAEKV